MYFYVGWSGMDTKQLTQKIIYKRNIEIVVKIFFYFHIIHLKNDLKLTKFIKREDLEKI